jgi:hypothetical protein
MEPHLKHDDEEQQTTGDLDADAGEHHHDTANLAEQIDEDEAGREEFAAVPGHVHVLPLFIPSTDEDSSQIPAGKASEFLLTAPTS